VAALLTGPCVVFALRRESLFFRRAFRPRHGFPGAPCRARLCGPSRQAVLVLETGLGARAMEAALEWVLGGLYRPPFLLSAGFSGALRPGQRVGDLVLATAVADTEGNRWPATWPGESNGKAAPDLERGDLLTSPALVASPAEKRRLAAEYGAVAVDMETAVVARHCHQHGVPFGCLRAISDDLDTPLSPELVGLLSGGQVSPFRLVVSLLRRPGLARELWRLEGQTRTAARQLAAGLARLLGW
jgi:adenosylhomocysteine nucleosidase